MMKNKTKPTNPMTPQEVAKFLKRHNAWRRGDNPPKYMPNPKKIGQAIDRAVELLAGLQDHINELEDDSIRDDSQKH